MAECMTPNLHCRMALKKNTDEGRGPLSGLEKWQVFWICVNFYIHFGWEICGLLFYSNFKEPGAWTEPPWAG